MIVRINQIDAARAEGDSGWPMSGLAAPVRNRALAAARAFELLILDQDEQGQPLPDLFRRTQLRQMIPLTIAALREAGDEVVVRLDGPLAEGQLLPAMRYLTEPDGQGRFALSEVRKMDDAPGGAIASLRAHMSSPARLVALCTDGAIGLERAVRLRAFLVSAQSARALMEITAPDDPDWDAVAEEVGLVLSPTRGLRSLQLLTQRLDGSAVKSRVMQHLIHTAQSTAAASHA